MHKKGEYFFSTVNRKFIVCVHYTYIHLQQLFIYYVPHYAVGCSHFYRWVRCCNVMCCGIEYRLFIKVIIRYYTTDKVNFTNLQDDEK